MDGGEWVSEVVGVEVSASVAMQQLSAGWQRMWVDGKMECFTGRWMGEDLQRDEG